MHRITRFVAAALAFTALAAVRTALNLLLRRSF